jgi:S-DNA-T family DNA segregation ATPase FtsK/SpoIIIE
MGAVFGLKAFSAGLGNFFARSYGILSFIIPIYLGYAAFILADSRWRPDRIFMLSASLFPFLTLAVGFVFIRDFDVRVRQFAFLDFAGKTGFSVVIVFITLLEILVLSIIKNALFGPADKSEARSRRVKNRRINNMGKPRVFLLPPPRAESSGEKENNRPPNESVAPEVVTEISAGGQVIHLPEIKPLAAARAFEELNKGDTSAAENTDEVLDELESVEADNAADSVEQAIEEAEAAALIHSEQARKKTAAVSSYRTKKKYNIPVEILNEYPDGEYWIIDQATREAAITLKETLEEFKIQAEVTGIRKGPVITMFEILPAPGVKLSRIVNLQDNIALRLAASSIRIVAPIPGKHAVGIEVPNAKRNIVSFREIIEGEIQREGKHPEIPVVMGKDITGEAQTVDLVQMPHLLIAGATGAGKSVCVNSMILSILYQLPPSQCRLILIDPKIVELKLYNDIPHLLTPVITEPKRAFQALQYCIYEMERRYACLDSMGVRDIRNYNKRVKERNIAQEYMPYIVIIIDEFADLMATTGKELESTVARLAAMSRAVGIHLVLATQRPSIDVITGLIKANIPSRIAFMVASKMDSRIIIDMVGAEKLLGKGDMLYAGVVDPFPIRMQGAFVSEEEVEAVVAHVKTFGEPEYIDDEIFYDEEEEELSPSLFSDGDDPLYDKALEIVLQQGKASASFIQRRLKIGYNRAARLVEEMEHKGVVGPAQGSKPRELLRGV